MILTKKKFVKNIKDVNKNVPNASGLDKRTDLNTKITQIEHNWCG